MVTKVDTHHSAVQFRHKLSSVNTSAKMADKVQSCHCTKNYHKNLQALGIYEIMPSSECKEFKMSEENKETVRMFFIGNNIKTQNWDDAKHKVMERDHPDLLDVVKGIPFKTKCIPPVFYTTFPKVLSHTEWELKQRKLDRSRAAIREENNRIMGDQAEKIIFDKLKNYFECKGDDVLIVHSHLFLYGSGPAREKDFLILNLTNGYLMQIEVKLSGKPDRFHHVMNQLSDGRYRMKKLLDSIKNGRKRQWSWTGIALFQYHSGLQLECRNCQEFVFFGFDGFDEQLGSIEKKIYAHQYNNQSNILEIRDRSVEFVEIAKQLLFCAQGNPEAPVTRNKVLQKTIAVLDEGSEVENIFFWTPGQKSAVESMEQRFMVLFGYYGTGKTLILKTRVWYLIRKLKASNYSSEIYLYTFREGHELDALIETFKAEFKGTEVKVRTLRTSIIDQFAFDDVTYEDHIIIDEAIIFDKTNIIDKTNNGADNFATTLHLAKSLVASLWIAVGAIDSKFELVDIKAKVKRNGYACPDLEYNMRNTNAIMKFAKKKPKNLDLGASVFLDLDVKYSSVFEGLAVDEDSYNYDSPFSAIISAFTEIPSNTKALIFTYLVVESFHDEELNQKKLEDELENGQERLIENIKRHFPQEKFVSFHDTEGAKQWFRFDRDKKLEAHLVFVTNDLPCYPIRGIECDVMIYVYPQQCRNGECQARYVIPSAITRCRAQLIVRQYRWIHDRCGRCIDKSKMKEKLKKMDLQEGTTYGKKTLEKWFQ